MTLLSLLIVSALGGRFAPIGSPSNCRTPFSTCLIGGASSGPPPPFSPSTLSLLAGQPGGPGNADGFGSNARFSAPTYVDTDGVNLFVTDTGNCTIRNIVISTGQVTTLAGLPGVCGETDGTGPVARFNEPEGIFYEQPPGELYIVDTGGNVLRAMPAVGGLVSTLTFTAGQFQSPSGITGVPSVGGAQNLFVTDAEALVLWWVDTGAATVTGLGGGGFNDLSGGVVFECGGECGGDGNLYASNGSSIYGIDLVTNVVTDYADGFNFLDGLAPLSTMNNPPSFAADQNGNQIYQISGAWSSTVIAGSGGVGHANGPVGSATFNGPTGVSSPGDVYVVDTGNDEVRDINVGTVVTTLAGAPGGSGFSNGTGSAAQFDQPIGLFYDGASTVYVADTVGCLIRKVTFPAGVVTTVAGSPGVCADADGTGSSAHFNLPHGITSDGTNLYVTDGNACTLRKVLISSGVTTTIAGVSGTCAEADGTGTAAHFNQPFAVVYDGSANLYVSDYSGNKIRKVVVSSVVVSSFAGSGSAGHADGTGAAATFNSPYGLAYDGVSNIYVADSSNDTIRKITVPGAVVSTVAGTALTPGSANGTGAAARFNLPIGLALDIADGLLFIGDSGNNTVRRMVTSSAVVSTLIGVVGQTGDQTGIALPAGLNVPYGLAFGSSKLFISDNEESAVLYAH